MDEVESRKKVRSPSFPFVGLREALDRARAFYEAEQRNAARPETAAAHWGYSPKSSGGKQTIAALRSFGLLEGDALVKLSGRALRILLDERDGSEERERLLKQAALMPPLHSKLWERYGPELPSPQTLRLSLILDEGFNENSVDDFLTEYKETLEFARLRGAEGGQPRAESSPIPSTPAAAPISTPVPRTTALHLVFEENSLELNVRRKISSKEAEHLRHLFELWLANVIER